MSIEGMLIIMYQEVPTTSVKDIEHNMILGEKDRQEELVYLPCELDSCVLVINSGCSFKDLVKNRFRNTSLNVAFFTLKTSTGY